jgi:gliding motility-associated-like protein
MYVRILSLLLACLLASFNLVNAQCCSNGNNLLANYNPDFSAPIDSGSNPPGFITDNIFSPNFLGGGLYSIIVSRNYGACSGTPQFDHTKGDTSGRYLWFDTDNFNTTPANPGLAWIPFDPSKPFGQQTLITVTPNTDYVFSCWVRDLARNPNCIGQGDAPIMGLRINGADLAQVDLAVPIPGQCCPGWVYLCSAWNSGNDTTAQIIIESRTGQGFTDLGIDDVYFGTTALGFNFTLGNDTNLCNGDTLQLIINLPNATYTWNNGDTTNSISVTQLGTYWVEVNQNGCIGRDSINVSLASILGNPFTLGNDTSYCAGSTITLTPNPLVSGFYSWQNGDTSKTITITQSGSYSLTVSNGCESFSDTINVNFVAPPIVKLPNDTVICDRNSYDLIALSENAASFLWNSGDTLNNILIVQTGNYAITVSNSCSNSVDSILVSFIKSAPKPFSNLEVDTCINAPILLNAGNSSYEYLWSTGATSASIYVNQDGIYFVTITNNSKCLVVDTINIIQQTCNECIAFVPNAFSPNSDQNNDLFKPYFNCPIKEYSMRIFNRWGEKVFETTNTQQGWDGNYMGEKMPPNVYVYLLKATYLNNKSFSEKGSVTLIR